MAIDLPEEGHRWRCTRCGNLTRFDVVRSVRTAEYWHFDLSGHPTVESTETLGGGIESVSCRWCRTGDAVVVVPAVAADA